MTSVDVYEGGDAKAADASKVISQSESSTREADLKGYNAAMRKLKIVSFVSVFFIAAQLTGGILANSIAIFTDTAHLASDMIGFAFSMIALKITLGPASLNYTFGLHRAEIIGTMVSVMFLIAITLWLVIEATKRVVAPQEIESTSMMITAIAGLFFNLI